MESITVASDNEIYDSRDNSNAIIEKSSNTLIVGCRNTVIPGTVTYIGQGAFSYRSGLASITIPNSVITIGDGAFLRCEDLISVVIPNSVTNIGYNAFRDCFSLKNITSFAVTPPACSSYVFYNVDKQACTLNVPEESVDLYKASDEWKDFYNIVGFTSGIDNAGINAAPEIVVRDGAIYVDGCPVGTAVEVYDATGKCVCSAVGDTLLPDFPTVYI